MYIKYRNYAAIHFKHRKHTAVHTKHCTPKHRKTTASRVLYHECTAACSKHYKAQNIIKHLTYRDAARKSQMHSHAQRALRIHIESAQILRIQPDIAVVQPPAHIAVTQPCAPSVANTQRVSSDIPTVQLRTPSAESTQCKNWLTHLVLLAWKKS